MINHSIFLTNCTSVIILRGQKGSYLSIEDMSFRIRKEKG